MQILKIQILMDACIYANVFLFVSEVKKIHHHPSTVICFRGIIHGTIKGGVNGKIKGVEEGGLESQAIFNSLVKVYIQKTEYQHIGQGHILVKVQVQGQAIQSIHTQVQDPGRGQDLGLDLDQGHYDERTRTEEDVGGATAGETKFYSAKKFC